MVAPDHEQEAESAGLDRYRCIIEAILPGRGSLTSDEHEAAVRGATSFVLQQVGELEPMLRLKLILGLAGFRAYVCARMLHPFDRLPIDKRHRLVDRWSYGLALRPRQLFRLIRSLALLAYYEHPAVRHSLLAAQSYSGPRSAAATVELRTGSAPAVRA